MRDSLARPADLQLIAGVLNVRWREAFWPVAGVRDLSHSSVFSKDGGTPNRDAARLKNRRTTPRPSARDANKRTIVRERLLAIASANPTAAAQSAMTRRCLQIRGYPPGELWPTSATVRTNPKFTPARHSFGDSKAGRLRRPSAREAVAGWR